MPNDKLSFPSSLREALAFEYVKLHIGPDDTPSRSCSSISKL